jgi:hypothetical protein
MELIEYIMLVLILMVNSAVTIIFSFLFSVLVKGLYVKLKREMPDWMAVFSFLSALLFSSLLITHFVTLNLRVGG